MPTQSKSPRSSPRKSPRSSPRKSPRLQLSNINVNLLINISKKNPRFASTIKDNYNRFYVRGYLYGERLNIYGAMKEMGLTRPLFDIKSIYRAHLKDVIENGIPNAENVMISKGTKSPAGNTWKRVRYTRMYIFGSDKLPSNPSFEIKNGVHQLRSLLYLISEQITNKKLREKLYTDTESAKGFRHGILNYIKDHLKLLENKYNYNTGLMEGRNLRYLMDHSQNNINNNSNNSNNNYNNNRIFISSDHMSNLLINKMINYGYSKSNQQSINNLAEMYSQVAYNGFNNEQGV